MRILMSTLALLLFSVSANAADYKCEVHIAYDVLPHALASLDKGLWQRCYPKERTHVCERELNSIETKVEHNAEDRSTSNRWVKYSSNRDKETCFDLAKLHCPVRRIQQFRSKTVTITFDGKAAGSYFCVDKKSPVFTESPSQADPQPGSSTPKKPNSKAPAN